jgi:AGZA family xanthine/uracil permease-like MFS transporter
MRRSAPALVLVGGMMLRNVQHLAWDDYTELLPSFLVLVGIPLSYSIADGLALGFIAYPLLKLLGGKVREVRAVSWVVAAALLCYSVFLRQGA